MIELRKNLRSMGKVAIAFSAGVDSTLLLAFARQELNDSVLALTVATELQSSQEMETAKSIAHELGANHLVIRLHLLNNPQINKNPRDRCYLCKKSVMAAVLRSAKEKGFSVVVDGTNADDARSTRPGLRALKELGVRSPLAEAGMTKDEVRAASVLLELPTKDKPSNPCLATRIPFDSPLTVDKLHMIEQAEASLLALGFVESRVRHHGTIARIEVPLIRFQEILNKKEQIVRLIQDAGFTYAVLDLQGYRQGSLEEDSKSNVDT